MLQIQTEIGYLTVDEKESFSLNLNVADIKDLSKRKGGYSKTITLVGDDNNIKQLGYLFDFDSENISIFNRNKKTKCSVIYKESLLFDGYIQLLRVKRISNSNSDYDIKIEVQVFDDASSFFSDMGEKELRDLTFEDFNHTFNRDTIINSWDNDYTDGYTYPTFSAVGSDYLLKHYKPAIYEYQIFKRIIEQNGYKFNFPQFNDDNIRMHKRIVPFTDAYSEDVFKKISYDYRVEAENSVIQTRVNDTNYHKYEIGGSSLTFAEGAIPFKNFNTNQTITNYANMFSVNLGFSTYDGQNQYNPFDSIIQDAGITEVIDWNYEIEYTAKLEMRAMSKSTNTPVQWYRNVVTSFPDTYRNRMDLKISSFVIKDDNINTAQYIGESTVYQFEYTDAWDNTIYPADWTEFGNEFTLTSNGTMSDVSSLMRMRMGTRVYADYFYTPVNGTEIQHENFGTTLVNPNLTRRQAFTNFIQFPLGEIYFETRITINNIRVKASPVIKSIPVGSTINMIDFTPNKVKQKDLFMDVMKSYNLFVIPEEKKLNIITRDKYYDDGEVLDLTDRFCNDKEYTIEFISNDMNRRQVFTYNNDEDIVNKRYVDSFSETFGTADYSLDNEYLRNEDITKLNYSSSPNIRTDLNITVPAIDNYDDKAKYKLRVLLNNGKKETDNFYNFYNSNDFTGTPISTKDYLHTSMFDDDIRPSFSICFDVPRIYFHNYTKYNTLTNLFQLHYARTFKQINEGRILKGWFRLDEKLFYNFSKKLNYRIYIKDFGYFYINKIVDYNPTKTFTMIELVTADIERKVNINKPTRPTLPIGDDIIPGPANPVTPISPNRPILDSVERIKDVFRKRTNVGDGFNYITGKYNNIQSVDNIIVGDKNSSYSDRNMIIGTNNEVYNNSNNFIYGDNIVVDSESPSSFLVQSDNLDLNTWKISEEKIENGIVAITTEGIEIGGNLIITEDEILLPTNPIVEVNTITVSTTITTESVILCNQISSINVTLPTPIDGKVITIKDISGNSKTNNIIIIGTIDNTTNYKIQTNYEAVKLVSDGTNWFRI